MDELTPSIEEIEEATFWSQHRFLLLIALTILTSLILVIIGLLAYNLSGAAQLDLSRPNLKSVSNQVEEDTSKATDYSAIGPVNSQTIEEFKQLFDSKAQSASAVDAFGGDPLNPDVLEFGKPNTGE